MARYPIFTKTMIVVVPACGLVPLAGLLLGALLATVLVMLVTA